MEINQAKVREYATRLLKARMRILASNGFYGLLIEHLPFALDETVETAATDGRKIYFCPKFLDEITDSELDFVLMHEVLHVVLQHCSRYQNRNPYAFNIACDIVINSTILDTFGGDTRKISIASAGGELMHLAPDGKEGCLYTAEEVYDMLPKSTKENSQNSQGNGNNSSNSQTGGSQSNQNNNQNDTSNNSNSQSGNSQKKGDNSQSGGGSGQQKNQPSQSANGSGSKKGSSKPQSGKDYQSATGQGTSFDDHSRWVGKGETDNEVAGAWEKYLDDALKAVSIDQTSTTWGNLPLFARRRLLEEKDGKVNWRQILNEFIQEEFYDYSFSPPDRRFGECDFFMPDFNVKDESVKNVLFMIDTSGSMSDELVSEAYDEIRGALYQFDGKLEGYLGFFDAVVVKPEPFSNFEELEIIRPQGGGGTSFHAIFDYVKNEIDVPPCAIIILTDGYAPYPDEEDALGIPVLWLINNECSSPPWGKVVRIPPEEQ